MVWTSMKCSIKQRCKNMSVLMFTAEECSTIPAGTYAGQDADIETTSLPVVAYTTSAMSDDAAYMMTKTFWEQKDAMGSAAAWWNGIDPSMISNITTAIHPGALRYYEEVGAPIVDAHR